MAKCKIIINGRPSGLLDLPVLMELNGVDVNNREDVFNAIKANIGNSPELQAQLQKIEAGLNTQASSLGSLGIFSGSPNLKVLGLFTAEDLIKQLYPNGTKGVDSLVPALLEVANKIKGNVLFVTIVNQKLMGQVDGSLTNINGAVLPPSNKIKGLDNKVIIIDGSDKNTIENTLLHELIHYLCDDIITNEDKTLARELLEMVKDLYNSRDSYPQDIKNTIETAYKFLNDPREVLAYLLGSNSFFSVFRNSKHFSVINAKLNGILEFAIPNTEIENKNHDDFVKKFLPNYGSRIGGPKLEVERNYDTEDAVIMDGNDTVNDDLSVSFNSEDHNSIPYLLSTGFVDNDKKMARMFKEKGHFSFKNILAAYDYLEANKKDVAKFWYPRQKPGQNVRTIRDLNTGDIIGVTDMTIFDTQELKNLGIRQNPEYPEMLNSRMVYNMIQKVENKNQALLDFIAKYDAQPIKYTKNYIIAGTACIDGKYLACIPVKFGKNGVKQVRINLESVGIDYIRKIDKAYTTQYERDSKGNLKQDAAGNPIIVQSKAKYDAFNISPEEKAAAALSLVKLKQALAGESVENSPLISFDRKDGGKFTTANLKSHIMLTGYGGDLNLQALDALPGDIIRYQRWEGKKSIVDFAVKLKNIPGGLFIYTEAGELKNISADDVISVVYDKANMMTPEMQKEIETMKLAIKESQAAKGHTLETWKDMIANSPYISTYAYWAFDKDERIERNKNIKRGDVAKIKVFFENGKPTYIYRPVLFTTSTHLYYVTAKGSIESVDTTWNSGNTSELVNGQWLYGKKENGNFVASTQSKAEICAVYHYNHDIELKQYLELFNASVLLLFQNGKLLKRDEDAYVSLDLITENMLGINKNSTEIARDASGKLIIPYSKTDLLAEWDIVDVGNYDRDAKIDATEDLVKGDLIKTQFIGSDGKVMTKWAMFAGYDPFTGEVKVIGLYSASTIREKKKKIVTFTKSVKFDDVLAVGRRTLPIARFDIQGTDGKLHTRYANTNDLKGLEEAGATNIKLISEGRVDRMEKLKNSFKYFITDGLKMSRIKGSEVKKVMLNKKMSTEYYKVAEIVDKGNGKIELVAADVNNLDNNKLYAILKTFKGSSKTHALTNMETKEGYWQDFGAYLKSIEQVLGYVQVGDYIETSYTKTDGKTGYWKGIVTAVTKSGLEYTMFGKNELGQFKPIKSYLFKNETNTKILAVYTLNIGGLIDSKTKTQAILEKLLSPEVLQAAPSNITGYRSRSRKSKNINNFKKSFDSRDSIIKVANKLSQMYGLDILVYTSEEFTELGKALGVDIDGVRGFCLDGQIYINADNASTADVLHELTHMLLPGLKAANPEAYALIMKKIKEHPDYQLIKSKYPELANHDLDEEVFCTIFAEYFREKKISEDKAAWVSGEFIAFSDAVPGVVENLFEVNVEGSSTSALMNMSLDEIFSVFGSLLVSGQYTEYYQPRAILSKNSLLLKVYSKLMDTGKLQKIC